MFLFLDYTRFGFELVNQKMSEMTFKKYPLHIPCHVPFENDSLLKCQFTTYL
jgi:hypothetical protein